MTKADLRRLLDTSLMRSDKVTEYGTWISQALQEIQNDYSWKCMRTRAYVTIASGADHAALPTDFKELQALQPPIWVTDLNNVGPYPCVVKTREQLMAFPTSLYFPITPARIGARNALPVFIEPVSGVDNLWTATLLEGALVFDVHYYQWLPELTEESDSNGLTVRYPVMVKSKLLAIAYADIQDPVAAAYEISYAAQRGRAILADAGRILAGRAIQMGG